ncbi:ExbD/TolR family protein [Campylobacter geochelonis]|uniref:Ferric siderophore transport system, biopolymer transport protein ExbD n=1 Tax=Campylobacter geochelonis TaxID=1780362 RepID=A0A128EA66_9BACT|nr:biopolymer transporter ExbD [Campylobacter geochelonis]QKF72089.1 TonB system transport protein ExbD [Campylobacter geochelonis]CZE45880.1 Ferric siderophore transport system%2C biopolymer transport protein ExbD [Campylobacter geochelonis]CZE46756.1 Ferric siderophore transport system%2C biopolymer transport protein ExbD [Campylobacter geochelonis]CZE49822.1 Ferric siderophore transport system%2C biopolymer transport protein ExbD [Campylobacter geochelonis]
MQEISIINLIDVIFMLLIFFMLTTTFKKSESFDVNLPKSSAKFEVDDNATARIYYDLSEVVSVVINDNEPIKLSFDELNQTLPSLNLNAFKSVHLSADKSHSYASIINLITVLKENQISNINLDIEKKN